MLLVRYVHLVCMLYVACQVKLCLFIIRAPLLVNCWVLDTCYWYNNNNTLVWVYNACNVGILQLSKRHWLLLLSPKTDTHFIILRMVEGWVNLHSWLYTEVVTHPHMVTHLSTNQVWHSATALIEADLQPLSQIATYYKLLLLYVDECYCIISV